MLLRLEKLLDALLGRTVCLPKIMHVFRGRKNEPWFRDGPPERGLVGADAQGSQEAPAHSLTFSLFPQIKTLPE